MIEAEMKWEWRAAARWAELWRRSLSPRVFPNHCNWRGFRTDTELDEYQHLPIKQGFKSRSDRKYSLQSEAPFSCCVLWAGIILRVADAPKVSLGLEERSKGLQRKFKLFFIIYFTIQIRDKVKQLLRNLRCCVWIINCEITLSLPVKLWLHLEVADLLEENQSLKIGSLNCFPAVLLGGGKKMVPPFF